MLDHLVRIQDALDAMDDTSCITREEFVKCNKPEVQHLYAEAWTDARTLVRIHGLAKATQQVAARIREAANVR